MPEPIRFVVRAEPIAQPRPRAAVIAGHAHVYEAERDHPVHSWKAAVALEARLACPAPLRGPLSVWLQFWLPRPKKDAQGTWHASKPDADNLAKAMDCCTGILWVDDGQVADLRITKKCVPEEKRPCLVVTVERLQ